MAFHGPSQPATKITEALSVDIVALEAELAAGEDAQYKDRLTPSE